MVDQPESFLEAYDNQGVITTTRPVTVQRARVSHHFKNLKLSLARGTGCWRSGCVALSGLILIATGLATGLYVRHSIDDNVANNMRVCAESDSNFKAWAQNFEGEPNETSIEADKEDTIPLYKQFYLYNMTNPSDYLNGAVPSLVERGPYVLREYVSFLDVEFHDDNNVTYDEWHFFVPQDGRNGTTNMFCEGCGTNDEFLNLNAAYLRLLGQGQNEGALLLAATCTAAQIGLIPAALNPKQSISFCSAKAAGNATASPCGCCNPYATAFPTPPGALKCSDLYSTEGTMAGLFSLLSYYDGGQPVAGAAKTRFTQRLYSSLVVSKTAKELALGFPTALAGYMLAKQTAIAVRALPPAIQPAALQKALAKQAAYTAQVGAKCAAHCTVEGDVQKLMTLFLTGNLEDAVRCEARLPNFISEPELRFLAAVSCRPYAFTMLTAVLCQTLPGGLGGGGGCQCADGLSDPRQGCCLSGGTFSVPALKIDLDLAGVGCLFEVPGIVGDRQFVSAESVKEFYGEDHKAGQFTGCGDAKKDWEHAGWGSIKNGQTQQDLWQWGQSKAPDMIDYDFLPPGPGRVAVFQDSSKRQPILGGETYTSTIRGGLGMRFPGLGVTSEVWSNHLTRHGHPYNKTFQVYIPQARRPVQVYFSRATTLKGIDVNVYRTNKRIMDRDFEDNAKTGTGVPMDGADCLTYNYGFPVFLHRPNFLFGDLRLLTQSQPPARLEFKGDRNIGVDIYRGFDGYDAGAKALDSPRHIDEQTLDQFQDDYDTIMSVEPSSGVAVAAHGRLGGSFAVFSCDPKDALNPSCVLFPNPSGQCYSRVAAQRTPFLPNSSFPCSAANIFTPKVVSDILVPQYWVDQTSEVNDHIARQLKAAGTLHMVAGLALLVLAPIGGLVLIGGIGFMAVTHYRSRSGRGAESEEHYAPMI